MGLGMSSEEEKRLKKAGLASPEMNSSTNQMAKGAVNSNQLAALGDKWRRNKEKKEKVIKEDKEKKIKEALA